MKLYDYVPPMRGELDQQLIIVDTYFREYHFPNYFFEYFLDTFMIDHVTCDPYEGTYPRMTDPKKCFCNNGNYHSLPIINIVFNQSSDNSRTFDLPPSSYLHQPYLTSDTVPTTNCILGI